MSSRIAALLALSWAAVLSAQSAPARAGVSSVEGIVLDAVTERPIVGAAVTTGVGGSGQGGALTDGEGRFRIGNLRANLYRFHAAKAGYLDGAFGRSAAGAAEEGVELQPGEHVTGLTIWLWQPAVVSGRVTNERDQPVAGVQVTGVRSGSRESEPAVTDDRGDYELRLPPGEYLVAVRSGFDRSTAPPPAAPDGSSRIYVSTFHPSVAAQSLAVSVRARSGERLENVDIKLVPAEPRRLAGRVQPKPPPSPEEVFLELRCLAGACALGSWKMYAQRNGSFEFAPLPAGDYLLTASLQTVHGDSITRAVDSDFAVMPLSLTDSDVSDLSVTLRPGPIVAGRIETDDGSVPSTVSLMLANFDSDWTAHGRSTPADGGTFVLRSVRPGRYRLHASTSEESSSVVPASTGWNLRAASLKGQDIVCQPLEVGTSDIRDVAVTLTRRTSAITGIVQNLDPGHGRAVVVTFPEDVARRTTGTSGWSPCMQYESVSGSGRFQISNLPEGDYFVAAIDLRRLDEWPSLEFLDVLSRSARRVSVEIGVTKTVDLRLSR
jgi:carboxypeptidase family protein